MIRGCNQDKSGKNMKPEKFALMERMKRIKTSENLQEAVSEENQCEK